VLRALTLALAALGGGPDGERFENPFYGHTVVVPPGWSARVDPQSRVTNLATYRAYRTDRLRQPPPAHARVVLFDHGRRACPREATRPGRPIELLGPSHFEGFFGYTALFCRAGHSLQVFVLVGRAVATARLEQARLAVGSLRLTPRAHAAANVHSSRVLGRSRGGRPIRAFRVGNPRSPRRVLVVGCIHGNECAGMAVTQRLVNLIRPLAADVWVIQNLNPDGLAARTRGNARGVDLNRDFDTFSQRESRIARTLIRRLRPALTIWFHQPQAVVRAWGGSRAVARRYARLAGERYRSLEWPPGAATRWQNGLGLRAFVVELSSGPLAGHAADRHAEAILRLAESR